jgi:2-oxoisovalerate dehydrogenase E2 component (dihydrolipoyl transacylase)
MLPSRDIYTFFKHIGNSAKIIFSNKNHVVRNFYVSANYAGQVSFKLSDIGEGIREVTIKEWFVKVGDKVAQFDEICEVQSDKASVTITSRYDGIIKKLHYKIDETASVGRPLVDIETDAEGQEQEKVQVTNEEPVEEKPIETSKNEPGMEVLCIPSVRRLAKEYKIDLSSVKGTGKAGRILKEDILKYLEKGAVHEVSREVLHDKTEPIKGFQKAMFKTMTDALKIPHFVYSDEITVSKLSELRRTIKTLPEGQDLKLSFMPFFIKAASNALQRYPVLNATLDTSGENIVYKGQHNIGIAMDTKAGLAVPVIKNVQKLTIIEINNELNRLIASGRNGTFSPQDLSDGTFTISNIGAIGGTYMKPIIMTPQVAIIALGTSQVVPRFDDANNVIPVEVLNLSGAADHRIIDGATMARFVQTLKKQIQEPYLLFLNQ